MTEEGGGGFTRMLTPHFWYPHPKDRGEERCYSATGIDFLVGQVWPVEGGFNWRLAFIRHGRRTTVGGGFIGTVDAGRFNCDRLAGVIARRIQFELSGFTWEDLSEHEWYRAVGGDVLSTHPGADGSKWAYGPAVGGEIFKCAFPNGMEGSVVHHLDSWFGSLRAMPWIRPLVVLGATDTREEAIQRVNEAYATLFPETLGRKEGGGRMTIPEGWERGGSEEWRHTYDTPAGYPPMRGRVYEVATYPPTTDAPTWGWELEKFYRSHLTAWADGSEGCATMEEAMKCADDAAQAIIETILEQARHGAKGNAS